MRESLPKHGDEFAAGHGHTGRSEVVHGAARDLLGGFEDRGRGPTPG